MLNQMRKSLSVKMAARAAAREAVNKILEAPTKEERDLSPEEGTAFNEARQKVRDIDEEIDAARTRIGELEEDERRDALVRGFRVDTDTSHEEGGHIAPAVVGYEAGSYERYGQRSYFRDLVSVSLNRAGLDDAGERLQRSNHETHVDAVALLRKTGSATPMEIRALTTTDGAGGDFVPPLWMIQEYITLARAARPVADRVKNLPLPTGTDSLNIPRLASGTAVAEQATQNTPVQNTDAVTNAVTANVTTLAGQQVVAVQLIEQSPINLDDILLEDLTLDYATKVDVFVLNNNAVGKKGLLFEALTIPEVYTDAAPTVPKLYSKLADAIQQIQSQRFLSPDTIAMHPRRWGWFLASLDSSNRPLILPTVGQGLYNALGTSLGQTAIGAAGNVGGVDVILDPSIPTNLGAGTNQDPILIFRAGDSILWEGAPNVEAFRETKADQLSVLLRFYRYVAFTAARYPKSIAVLNGTGTIAPTF